MDVSSGQAGVFVLNGAGDDNDTIDGAGVEGDAAAQAAAPVIKRRSAIACRR
jgi:hypothetical protein